MAAAIAACADGEVGVHVEPIDAYRSYDGFQPARDKAILARASRADASEAGVRIFQEVLPAGIELKDDVMSVADGYDHELIGKYAYSSGKTAPKVDLIEHVEKLTIAAGGDAAIVTFDATDPKDYDRALAVEAIVIKLDPRFLAPSVSSSAPSGAPALGSSANP